MRKMKKKLICLLLTFVMLAGMLPGFAVAAFADRSLDLSADVNGSFSWTLYTPDEGVTIAITGTSGSLPQGGNLSIEGGSLMLRGTASAAGVTSATVSLSLTQGEETSSENITVRVTVHGAPVVNTSGTATLRVGVQSSLSYVMSNGGTISSVSVSEGTVPPGMTVSADSTTVYVRGTPTQAGTYSLTIRCTDSVIDAQRSQPLVLTVEEAENGTGSSDPSESEPESSETASSETEPAPEVTKHPGGETVTEGGSAVFIARAKNAEKIIWHIVSQDGSKDYLMKDAPQYFNGLIVSGLETERLQLDRIPLSMNNWSVVAEFEGPGGNVMSKGAVLRVNKAELKAPEISVQPKSAELEFGETTTLRISAVAEAGLELSYQWYMNDKDSTLGGKAIDGATKDTYTPEYREGTTYYYCAVRAKTDTELSPAAKSRCAAISYTPKPTETTQPETQETKPEPTETHAPTVPQETIQHTTTSAQSSAVKGFKAVLIVALILCLLAIAAVLVAVILRFYPPDVESLPPFLRRFLEESEEYDDDANP